MYSTIIASPPYPDKRYCSPHHEDSVGHNWRIPNVRGKRAVRHT